VLSTDRLQIEPAATTSMTLRLSAQTRRLLRKRRVPHLELGIAIDGRSGVSHVPIAISPRTPG
jgi:hypothetical protein